MNNSEALFFLCFQKWRKVSMENVRETILDDAKHAVCGDRDHQYGSPEDNFDQIARFWSIYLHTNLSSCDVANMMILFKLARNMTGEPKLDNWVDIAGYAACGADCQCYYEKGFTDYTDIRRVITKMKC